MIIESSQAIRRDRRPSTDPISIILKYKLSIEGNFKFLKIHYIKLKTTHLIKITDDN